MNDPSVDNNPGHSSAAEALKSCIDAGDTERVLHLLKLGKF